MTGGWPHIGAGELAARIRSELGSGTWLCLLAPASEVPQVAENIHATLECGGTQLSCAQLDGAVGPMVTATRDGVLLVSGFETLSDAAWEHLDLLRSRLERTQPALLVMAPKAMEQLIRHAPNLASWLGGQFLSWDGTAELLTPEEKEARLAHLREKLGKTDEQVIEMAQAGTPLDEPDYAEWLVLLDRGDLVRR